MFHQPGRETRAVGPDGQKLAVEALHAAFTNLRITIEDVVVSGDRAAVRDRLTGVHTGSFAGIAPRGKRLDLMRIVIYRVEGGMIRESWGHRLRDVFESIPNPSWDVGSGETTLRAAQAQQLESLNPLRKINAPEA